MLLQFSVSNFKTFKEKATLSLVASNYDKQTKEDDNISYNEPLDLRILKSTVIYGANASGKSKFLEAFMFMRSFVISSSKDSQTGDEIEVEQFKLNVETEDAPSEFEVIFVDKNHFYRYGFEANRQHVVAEWLYHKPKTKEIELFYRDYQSFETHQRNFSKGNTVIKQGLVRDNALLISVAAQFNETISIAVIDWFKKVKAIKGLDDAAYKGFSIFKSQNPADKLKMLELLKAADLGIHDIKFNKLDANKLPKDMSKEIRERIIKEMKEKNAEIVSDILTSHKKFDASGNVVGNVEFEMHKNESSGTNKFFSLLGPILDVLENGDILIVDELDAKLHPNLVCKIISLFNSEIVNQKNAQLIFNTHDTNLLSSGLFRRDQIWFTEKNSYGEARLFSLADFKADDVRKGEAFEENYIRGKYGAVPYLGFFDQLTQALSYHENEGQKS